VDFWDTFYNLCEKNGTKPNAVAKELGLSSATCTYWKKSRKSPSADNLSQIADYFGVTTDYLLGVSPTPIKSNATVLDSSNIYMRPVFESVSAGFGAYASNEIVEYMPVFIENPYDVEDTICVKVKGNSMYPKIEDGDRIVVRKQSSVDSGKIAVVRIGDEAVVKKVEYDDLSRGLTLLSINPEYPPRTLSGEELENVAIVGLVRQIIKEV
jgi:repressor LexA